MAVYDDNRDINTRWTASTENIFPSSSIYVHTISLLGPVNWWSHEVFSSVSKFHNKPLVISLVDFNPLSAVTLSEIGHAWLISMHSWDKHDGILAIVSHSPWYCFANQHGILDIRLRIRHADDGVSLSRVYNMVNRANWPFLGGVDLVEWTAQCFIRCHWFL